MRLRAAIIMALLPIAATSVSAEPRSPTEVVRALAASAIGPASTNSRMESAERAFMTASLYRIARHGVGNVITYTQDATDAVIDSVKAHGKSVSVTFLVTGSGARYTHEYLLVDRDGMWKVDDIIYHFDRGAKTFSLRNAPPDDH